MRAPLAGTLILNTCRRQMKLDALYVVVRDMHTAREFYVPALRA